MEQVASRSVFIRRFVTAESGVCRRGCVRPVTGRMEKGQMDTIRFTETRVRRDDGPDLVFMGELVEGAETSPDSGRWNYSGSAGRWIELHLYRTEAGAFVCHEGRMTNWDGEHHQHRAAVCHATSEIFAFFGFGKLAKELYQNAGLDDAERVA